MKVLKTKFEGLLVIEPSLYSDRRGSFYESWHQKLYREVGLEQFVQDDVSISHKNVLRGMHFQEGQGKLISVVHGEILDVLIDIRPHSLTYLSHFAIQLSSQKPCQVYAPPGFAHGFYVLSEYVVMNYKCTQYYNKELEGGLRWDDPVFAIQWPCGNPVMSDRDLNFLPCGLRRETSKRTLLR